jgi:hypothetical protein
MNHEWRDIIIKADHGIIIADHGDHDPESDQHCESANAETT